MSTRRTLLLQNLARELAGRVHIMQVCWLLLSELLIVMNMDMNMFKEREYEHVQIHLYPHIEFPRIHGIFRKIPSGRVYTKAWKFQVNISQRPNNRTLTHEILDLRLFHELNHPGLLFHYPMLFRI